MNGRLVGYLVGRFTGCLLLLDLGFELLWRQVLLIVIRVFLWEESTRVIQMRVWMQRLGQDVGWVLACTYPADFTIAVGTILLDGVITNIN